MLRYQVDDMSCGHCAQSITNAVKGVDPSAQVKVDLATRSVEVATSAADAQVSGAIRAAGYTPAQPIQGVAPKRSSCCGGR